MELKEMRKKKGYSQATLAQLSGINLRSLQDYEQGHKSLASAKGETLYRLSQVLGYSMEDIVSDFCADSSLWKNNETRRNERVQAYASALQRRKKEVTHFPIIISDPMVDMSRIYPTKQREVKAVIDRFRNDIRLHSIRLFGSSITMSCHKDSDLDFAIELITPSETIKNDISEQIQICCDWNADILWLDRVTSTDRIYEDIMKGLVII